MGKYVDIPAIVQVIGGIYLDPSLLDLTDKYNLCKHDFTERFHKMIFGTLFQLHALGAKEITISTIEDYLKDKPESEALFVQNNGEKWLTELKQITKPEAFDYYYGRVKKLSLLRAYHNCGIDVRDIYDDDEIFDTKKIKEQGEWLDEHTMADIAKRVDEKIDRIKAEYTGEEFKKPRQAGEGLEELIKSLKENPDFGVPLYGDLVNTVTRGARLGKFYLRSSSAGFGKSRTMLADAAYISCCSMWDSDQEKWILLESQQPTFFITTEQRLDEIQTMLLAFIAGVDEDKILESRCTDEEQDRLQMAAGIIAQSPLYIEEMPDFSMDDVENQVKRGIRDHGARYIFLDYIHSSIKILEEITRRTGGIKLREDSVLFMIAIKLKDICVQNDVFILSSTQLNAGYVDSTEPDQNLLRGAKSIADRDNSLKVINRLIRKRNKWKKLLAWSKKKLKV